MDPKELVKRGYELFGKGDMQTFFTEVVHDDITWIFPGDKHPMSGTHKGKEAMMKTMSLVPQLWDCLLYTSPSPRDRTRSRMPSSA